LSSAKFNEDILSLSTVSILSTTDPEDSEFTYELVSGDGDQDNKQFLTEINNLNGPISKLFETDLEIEPITSTNSGGSRNNSTKKSRKSRKSKKTKKRVKHNSTKKTHKKKS